jgi:putative oxidoreductase
LFDWLQRQAPKILAITRILFGTMMALHGAQKVFLLWGGLPPGVPPFIRWGAGLIELVGGALIAVGLFTRPAAFVMSGLMAFAYFMGHAPNGFLPTVNQGELAVIYCWFALYLAAAGPGAWALDGMREYRVAPAAPVL